MIKSFACNETENIWNKFVSKKLPYDIQNRALKKLRWLDASKSINDLRVPPSNHLEKLSGNLEGYYSIRINSQWRICFQWSGENAFNVEILDYH